MWLGIGIDFLQFVAFVGVVVLVGMLARSIDKWRFNRVLEWDEKQKSAPEEQDPPQMRKDGDRS